jgi:DNA-binding Xre family transcriptional regulator
MRNPAKILLDELLSEKNISMRKLALEIRVKPSTLSRIKSGKTETGTLKTYMKILQYKNRIVRQEHLAKERRECTRG